VKNGPEQVKVQQARAAGGGGGGEAGAGPGGPGEAEPELHEDHGADYGHCEQEERGVGENLSVGQSLMTIVPLTDLWVTANFKETQLKKMQAARRSRSRWTRWAGASSPGRCTDWRSDGLVAEPVSAGERDGQLCEGGAADSGAHQLYQPEGRKRQDYKLRIGMSADPTVRVK
jgi:membrane fusion protein (multidrug efflux system)